MFSMNRKIAFLIVVGLNLAACNSGSGTGFASTPTGVSPATSGQTFSIGGKPGGLDSGQQLTLAKRDGAKLTLTATGWTNLTNTQTNGHINATNFGIYAPLNQFNLMTIDEQNNLVFEYRGNNDDFAIFNPYGNTEQYVLRYDNLPVTGVNGPTTLSAHYVGPFDDQVFMGVTDFLGGSLYQYDTSKQSYINISSYNGGYAPYATAYYNDTLWWADSYGYGYFGAEARINIPYSTGSATNMVFDSNGNLYIAATDGSNDSTLVVCTNKSGPFTNCSLTDSGSNDIISSLVADQSGNVFAAWSDENLNLHVISYNYNIRGAIGTLIYTGVMSPNNLGVKCSNFALVSTQQTQLGLLAYNKVTGNLILTYPSDGDSLIVLTESGTIVTENLPPNLPSGNTSANPVCALDVDSNGMIYINQTYLVNPPNQFNSDIYYYLNNQ